LLLIFGCNLHNGDEIGLLNRFRRYKDDEEAVGYQLEQK
jgi:hypothetical protein